jgi:hypothetical protein
VGGQEYQDVFYAQIPQANLVRRITGITEAIRLDTATERHVEEVGAYWPSGVSSTAAMTLSEFTVNCR